MTGMSFAEFKYGSRVLGNQINSGIPLPEEWKSNVNTEPTWKMGGSEERTDWALVVIEPDQSLNLKPTSVRVHTYIQMFKKTEELVESLQTQSAESLQELMGLSAKTAKGHAERFQSFHKLPPKQAVLMLGGDTLGADDFGDSDFGYAEKHLRMVSGLYGVLRPLDDIKPVRDVPFGAKLATKKGKTIADFWGDAISKHLVKDAKGDSSSRKPLMILLLSDEYFPAVQVETLPKDVKSVRVVFEGGSDSEVRKARGQIGRWCIYKRIATIDDLQDFEHEDWKMDKFKSSSSRIVFVWVGDSASDGKKGKKKKKDSGDRGGKSKDKDKGKSKADASASRSRSRGKGRTDKKRKKSASPSPAASDSDASEGAARKRKKKEKRARSASASRSPSRKRKDRERGRRGGGDGGRRKARSASS